MKDEHCRFPCTLENCAAPLSECQERLKKLWSVVTMASIQDACIYSEKSTYVKILDGLRRSLKRAREKETIRSLNKAIRANMDILSSHQECERIARESLNSLSGDSYLGVWQLLGYDKADAKKVIDFINGLRHTTKYSRMASSDGNFHRHDTRGRPATREFYEIVKDYLQSIGKTLQEEIILPDE